MTWIRRNWLWLIVLPLCVAAALFAASHRLLEIYWPSQPTKPIAVDSGTVHYQSELVNAGTTYERNIDVTFNGSSSVDSHEGVIAVEGARLWAFDFTMEAASDVIADGCTIVALDADGRQYFPRAATAQDPSYTELPAPPCVPADAQGPTIDYFTGEVTDSLSPRPSQWDTRLVIAMPEGVEPSAVRIYWDLPHYAEFAIR
ncbi:MAG: hypothetical protein Q4P05_08300 [Actinomycetaceae bacterium]|nr:hypothetical protein [Actinomycetaceae bacterium]